MVTFCHGESPPVFHRYPLYYKGFWGFRLYFYEISGLSNLFSILDNIRLATLLEEVKTSGKLKAIYKLEEMDKQEQKFLDALAIDNFHTTRPKFSNVGVYT